MTFIGAGHETTANALSWSLYLLSQAPQIRRRVEAEVDASPPDEGGGGAADDPPTGPTRAARPRRPRTVAPDDDPEFLRSLDERIQREDPPSA